MKKRFLNLVGILLVIAGLLPISPASADQGPAEPASAEQSPAQPGLTWDQLLERARPDTKVVPVTNQDGTHYEAAWSSDDLKVRLPDKANDWVALPAGPEQSVSYRPVGAHPVQGTASGSTVTFAAAWDGADLVESVEPGRYKETIVLHNPPSRNTWTFDVKESGVSAKQEQGTITFGIEGLALLTVRDLIAKDASGAEMPVQATLRTVGQNDYIDLTVDSAWLAAAAYPVEIDPTTIGPQPQFVAQTESLITELSDGRLVVTLGSTIYTSTDKGTTWTVLSTISDGSDQMCVTSDNSKNLYVLYSSPASGYRIWRFRKLAWNGSSWTVGGYSELTGSMLVTRGCSMTWDAKYNNVIMAYSTNGMSASPTTYDWRYYRVATSSLSGSYQLEYYSGSQCACDVNVHVSPTTGYLYFVWQNLPLTGFALRSYTTSDGANYYQQYNTNPFYAGVDNDSTVDANGNIVIATYNPNTYYLSVTTYTVSSNTFSTRTLETSGVAYDRPAITNLNGDLYLYFVGGDGSIYYRLFKKSLGDWQNKTLLETGKYAEIVATQSYRTNAGAWAAWRDTNTSKVVFGGVLIPQAPYAATNLSPSGNTWVNTLTPTLTWTYANPNPSDGQGAFEVQIKNGAGTVVLDTGKVTSTTSSYTVPASILADSSSYTWAVSTWDVKGSLQGPYSTWASFRVDKVAPVVTASVNGGAAYTKTTAVNLAISATDSSSGPSQMDFTYKGTTSAWEAYATSKAYTLTGPDGLQTVTVNVKDAAGNVGTANASITLDTTAPTVSLTAPADGSSVGGVVTVQSNPSDSGAIQKVMYYAGNTLIGTAMASPWQVTWDTNQTANGTYSLTAVAYDLAGNSATSVASSVNVDNHAPTVTLTKPVDGETVRGMYALQADATDSVGISKVEYYVDGSLVGSATAAPYTINWNTASVTNAAHTVSAKAYNTYGNNSATSPVTVTVDNSSVTGTLAVASGSTAGPSETLSLTSTSEWATSWNNIEYKLSTDSNWTHVQAGSGSFSGGAASIAWTVPSTSGTWQIRVGLVDSQNNSGYTSTLELVLPDAPSISATAGNQGDLFLRLPAPQAGRSYALYRSTSSAFTADTTDELAHTFAGTSFRDGVNHVINSSFEWGTQAGGLPKNWSRLGADGSVSVVNSDSGLGLSALAIHKSTASGQDGASQTVFTGRGLVGRTATLSGWLCANNVSTGTGAGAWLEVRFFRRDGTLISTLPTQAVTGTTGWTRYSTTGTVPVGTYTIDVAVVAGASTGDVSADGVQFEPSADLSTYTAGSLLDAKAYFYYAVEWAGSLHSAPSATTSATYRGLPDVFGWWTRYVR